MAIKHGWLQAVCPCTGATMVAPTSGRNKCAACTESRALQRLRAGLSRQLGSKGRSLAWGTYPQRLGAGHVESGQLLGDAFYVSRPGCVHRPPAQRLLDATRRLQQQKVLERAAQPSAA